MKLHVGDEFDKIVDVMNTVFDWNYKACMKGYYVVSDNPQTAAWFPKIATLENGIPQPGDKWYGWCNTISNDGEYIYSQNYSNPIKMGNGSLESNIKRITFIKYPNGKYQYVGVYVTYKLDPVKGWINKRVAKDIDVENYITGDY